MHAYAICSGRFEDKMGRNAVNEKMGHRFKINLTYPISSDLQQQLAAMISINSPTSFFYFLPAYEASLYGGYIVFIAKQVYLHCTRHDSDVSLSNATCHVYERNFDIKTHAV